MFFRPSRKMTKGAAPLVLTSAPVPGFFAGTCVATQYAWTKVEELSIGDTVLTAQNGEQAIIDIDHGSLSVAANTAAAGQWPILVPEGVLGNDAPLRLSPATRVVIEHEAVEQLFGSPRASVKAQNLIGYRGIARARIEGSLDHVTLYFEKPQTLVAHGDLFFDVPDASGVFPFLPLSDRQSRLLVRAMDEAYRYGRAFL